MYIYQELLLSRSEGLILLNELINQCSTEVFTQHAETWARLLTGILQVEFTKIDVNSSALSFNLALIKKYLSDY